MYIVSTEGFSALSLFVSSRTLEMFNFWGHEIFKILNIAAYDLWLLSTIYCHWPSKPLRCLAKLWGKYNLNQVWLLLCVRQVIKEMCCFSLVGVQIVVKMSFEEKAIKLLPQLQPCSKLCTGGRSEIILPPLPLSGFCLLSLLLVITQTLFCA